MMHGTMSLKFKFGTLDFWLPPGSRSEMSAFSLG